MKALRHFLFFYAFYFVLLPLRSFLYSQDPKELYDTWLSFHDFWLDITSLISFFAFSICIQWILNRYHNHGKHKMWLYTIPLAVLGPIFLRFFIQEVLGPRIVGFANYYEPYTMAYYIMDNLYFAIIFILFGVCYFYINYAIDQHRNQLRLLKLNKELQSDQLRSQLNGHFLLNTMNSVYALIEMNDGRAAMAMEALSGLLQYTIYEDREKVALNEELTRIQELKAIHTIRQKDPLYLDIQVDVDDHVKIPPFLLLPIVENILKHAVLNDEINRPTVSITMNNHFLEIASSNKIAEKKKDGIGGVGIENLKQRLQFMYGDQASLRYDTRESFYFVDMKIPVS